MPILAATVCAAVTVHDGDTFRCDGERVRIANIDAPELLGSSRCNPRQLRAGRNPSWCDYALAERSRLALRSFLARGQVEIERTGRQSYGRTVARVSVKGRDAGAYLVGLGLARWWVKDKLEFALIAEMIALGAAVWFWGKL